MNTFLKVLGVLFIIALLIFVIGFIANSEFAWARYEGFVKPGATQAPPISGGGPTAAPPVSGGGNLQDVMYVDGIPYYFGTGGEIHMDTSLVTWNGGHLTFVSATPFSVNNVNGTVKLNGQLCSNGNPVTCNGTPVLIGSLDIVWFKNTDGTRNDSNGALIFRP